ncbi:hypothetical protein ACIHEJ_30310 [Streptomyces sp. NPDC052301]|uniref:hypothetical protein n=1 Tax=Streptomyces sp. NPDC052301 TaxID=3365687 RepID=UPI0037D05E08
MIDEFLVEECLADLREDAAGPPRPDVVAVTRGVVETAVASGISPDSPRADSVVATLTAGCALAVGRPDEARTRRTAAPRTYAV